MLLRVLAVAICATASWTIPSTAQTLAQISGPREVPPASFKGDQFVDSRGCIFVRAGLNGQTSWVPRVGQDRKVLCGYPPTFGARERVPAVADTAVAAAAPETRAPAAAAPAASAPAPAVRSEPVRVADATPGCPASAPYGRPGVSAQGKPILTCSARKPAPDVVAAPAPVVAAAAPAPAPVAAPAPVRTAAASYPANSVPARVLKATGPGPGQVMCPASMPVLVRVPLTTGGSALLCTAGQQPIVTAAAPTYPPGSGLAPSISNRTAGTATARSAAPAARAATGTQVARVDEVMTPPPGWKRAWKDDRLNPMRGKGTAQGWAQQDQVWTRTVPAQAVVTTKPAVPAPVESTRVVTTSTRSPTVEAPARTQPRVTVSTRSDATAPAPRKAAPQAAGNAYVQVGTFGEPANATGAAGRLKALGLPVATSKFTKGGRQLQIVLAGPFASAADAQSALSAARRAGFGDAFIR